MLDLYSTFHKIRVVLKIYSAAFTISEPFLLLKQLGIMHLAQGCVTLVFGIWTHQLLIIIREVVQTHEMHMWKIWASAGISLISWLQSNSQLQEVLHSMLVFYLLHVKIFCIYAIPWVYTTSLFWRIPGSLMISHMTFLFWLDLFLLYFYNSYFN